MNAVDKWHDVMKSGGSGAEDKLDELLHEDVIFYSPVVFTPQRGKEITKLYLSAASVSYTHLTLPTNREV